MKGWNRLLVGCMALVALGLFLVADSNANGFRSKSVAKTRSTLFGNGTVSKAKTFGPGASAAASSGFGVGASAASAGGFRGASVSVANVPFVPVAKVNSAFLVNGAVASAGVPVLLNSHGVRFNSFGTSTVQDAFGNVFELDAFGNSRLVGNRLGASSLGVVPFQPVFIPSGFGVSSFSVRSSCR